MECKERLETYLRAHRVPFALTHHIRAYSAQEVAAAEHVPGRQVAKTVIVHTNGRAVMLALPASHRVDMARAAALVGAQHVRMADEKEFAASFPDCEVGAMPPFGNLYGLPVYVDRTLAEDDTIVFRAGTHTDTMSITYADFDHLVHPVVGEFARHV